MPAPKTPAQKAKAKRGAVYLVHRFRFSERSRPVSKYFALLEGYGEGKRDLIVAFFTSRTEFHYRRTTVLVAANVIPGIVEPSLLDCGNWRILPSSQLFSGKVRYLGQLPSEVVDQVDDAIEHIKDIDEATWLRMCG